MEDQQAEDQHPGAPWLVGDLPLELSFECESVIRKIAELNDAQARELAKVALKHNFRLVHMLRQSIDRVHEVEAVVDELCEQITGEDA
jgi:hypothetical protein